MDSLTNAITSFFYDLWRVLLLVLNDFFMFIWDSLLHLFVSVVKLLDLSAIKQYLSDNNVSGLSGDLINMLGLLGVQYALSIILAAITVRLLMSFIVFVRFK